MRAAAAARSLPVTAEAADLREHLPPRSFDAVVSIGLLPYFDCARAAPARAAARRGTPGGVAAINVLIEGTTWREAFGNEPFCLFAPDSLHRALAGWTVLLGREQSFDAPGGTVKRFSTLIARRPA